jgi:hypothetical protein
MIKITKRKSGKTTELDVSFSSLEEAISYAEENIISKDTNKYITYRYKVDTKPLKATVKEYVFIDENEYFLYSYKIADVR